MLKRSIIVSLLAMAQQIQAEDLVSKLVDGDDLKALQEVITNTVASCADKIVVNPADLSLAQNELGEILKGIAEVTSQKLLTLALKPDYPNACHVLADKILGEIEEPEEKSSHCLNKVWGRCIQWEKRSTPTFKYYWPKYFIEVSTKGSDPHPAFAEGNKLYIASRKIAFSLAPLVDLQGPHKLLAKVVGGAAALKGLTGFDMSPGEDELGNAMQSTVLLPFEKMRIRANQDPSLASYEVNVWPVGLSQTIAQHLTVCGTGGYAWKIPGVPMTCPVAMSRDAWSYWDTGFLDYLNPNSIRGMKAASNPIACTADNLAGEAFDRIAGSEETSAVGSGEGENKKKTALSDLPTNFRGMGFCSFPIMGDAEAISSLYLGLPGAFSGPWCTLWGPLVPRQSTVHYQSDYAFANSALRFKTLAHDLFGTPRGAQERWSLAFPWEERPGNQAMKKVMAALKKYLGDSGVANDLLEKSFKDGGRSTLLMVPGDPRLIDLSYSDLRTISTGLAKEAAYLLALNRIGAEAEREALEQFVSQRVGIDRFSPKSPEDTLRDGKRGLENVTDDTAKLAREAIYETKGYCHFSREDDGTIIGDPRYTFDVPGHGSLAFVPMSKSDCLAERQGGRCLKRHRVSRKCISRQIHTYLWLGKKEVTGYQEVQNPRRFEVRAARCSSSGYATPNTRQEYHDCAESVGEVGREDTRERLKEPDPAHPEELVQEDEQTAKAVGIAAKGAAWVGTEFARLRYDEMLGTSTLPGKKRVYTIWEKVSCKPESSMGLPIYRKQVGPAWLWSSCEAAVRYEIRKYFQTKLLRKTCDKLLSFPLGDPFN